MKKIVRFLIFMAVLICAATASAQEAELIVELGIFDYGTIVIPSEAEFELYSKDGECVASSKGNIDANTQKLSLAFNIPEYEDGATYMLMPVAGVTELNYIGTKYKIGSQIPLNTADGMTFSMEAVPLYKPKTGARTDKVTVRLHIRNTVTFPAKARFFLCNSEGELLSAKTADINTSNSPVTLEFPVSQYYTGEQFYLVAASGVLDVTYYDTTYNKFSPIKIGTYAAVAEDGKIVVGNSFDVGITVDTQAIESDYAAAVESYINSTGIDSKTNYFIWVSKKDYKLNVLARNNGIWDYVLSFDCTIGKPSTPTITGVFEYFQYQEKWTYADYYVAPIMRFAPKGYAMHSTLVKYNGEPYDARLRLPLSHGCVRLAPQDIRWLADNIPLYTRVYITE